MGRLSTHVLDTANGMPAEGIRIELFRGVTGGSAALKSVTANADGRTEAPLLEGGELLPGAYEIVFHVGEYFRRRGHPDAGRFLDSVPVRFIVEDPSSRYHVPLLVSPWSYTTYRGS